MSSLLAVWGAVPFSFPGISMAVETYAVQLERVQGLIAAIEASPNAQTSVLGRSFTKHDLASLYAREEKLRGLAKRETAGGVIVRQVVPL